MAIPLLNQDKAVDRLLLDLVHLSSTIVININAYKRAGGGVGIASVYLAWAFFFVTVMYVNNMGLMYWTDYPLTGNKELVENVQRDVVLWGDIV